MNQPAKPVYRFGPIRYDRGQRLLFREDEMVPLAPKVAETLRVLLERHGKVVAKARAPSVKGKAMKKNVQRKGERFPRPPEGPYAPCRIDACVGVILFLADHRCPPPTL
jgi:hypothetical protein